METKKNSSILQKGCSRHYQAKKCKSCKKYTQYNKELGKMWKKNGDVDTNNKTYKLQQAYSRKCDKCVSKSKKCTPQKMKKYVKWLDQSRVI